MTLAWITRPAAVADGQPRKYRSGTAAKSAAADGYCCVCVARVCSFNLVCFTCGSDLKAASMHADHRALLAPQGNQTDTRPNSAARTGRSPRRRSAQRAAAATPVWAGRKPPACHPTSRCGRALRRRPRAPVTVFRPVRNFGAEFQHIVHALSTAHQQPRAPSDSSHCRQGPLRRLLG